MIPFNQPHLGGKELWYIAQAHAHGQLAGLFEDTQREKAVDDAGNWVWKRQ